MRSRIKLAPVAAHATLAAFSLISVLPLLLVMMNSWKTSNAIFAAPLAFPTSKTFASEGYTAVLGHADLLVWALNSLIVTAASVAGILAFGSMAAFALTEYPFRGSNLVSAYVLLGIMVPIRLGTVGIVEVMSATALINTLWALILVYIAQGLPMAVFILSEFMRKIPTDLKNAARMDGLSEYRLFLIVVLPLVRPALATVAVFTLIPIWNDLWFPLILAPSDATKTLTLGLQVFLGQHITHWNVVLAALTLALLPIFGFYLAFSRNFIRGLTAGAVK